MLFVVSGEAICAHSIIARKAVIDFVFAVFGVFMNVGCFKLVYLRVSSLNQSREALENEEYDDKKRKISAVRAAFSVVLGPTFSYNHCQCCRRRHPTYNHGGRKGGAFLSRIVRFLAGSL